jgi:transcriptional antiterminator NusG
MVKKIRNFFREVLSEVEKVTWPGKREIIASTIVVIVLVLIVATYVGIVDFFLSWLLSMVRWYVINTYTGHEEKVKNYIEKLKASKGLGEKINEILIPYNDIVALRKGKKKIVEKEFFPGYILINMIMDDETYWSLKNIPGVTDFLCGKPENPVPLQPKEFDRITGLIEKKKDEEPQSAVSFKKGDRVRIIDGPFDNFMGMVEDADEPKQKVRVMVTIFGRTTPVELDFLQVEKV